MTLRRVFGQIRPQATGDLAIKTGEKVGPVSVDMGKTACKVPYAPDYIKKVQKRASARC